MAGKQSGCSLLAQVYSGWNLEATFRARAALLPAPVSWGGNKDFAAIWPAASPLKAVSLVAAREVLGLVDHIL
jgi:hypothetical protein